MKWPFSSPTPAGGRPGRQTFPTRLRRTFLYFFFVLLAAGVIAAGVFGARFVHGFTYKSDYFKVREIRIGGASPALEREARAWLAAQCALAGNNLCRLDAKKLMAGLAALPRTRSAVVTKEFPQTLHVALTERTPLLAVNLNDHFFQVDEEGVLIAKTGLEAIRQGGLPVLTGIRGTQWKPGSRLCQPNLDKVLRAAVFVRDEDPLLQKKIIEWNLSPQEEISAILVSRTEVRFGERSPLATLDKLSSILATRKELEKSIYIDLRMEKQIVYLPR